MPNIPLTPEQIKQIKEQRQQAMDARRINMLFRSMEIRREQEIQQYEKRNTKQEIGPKDTIPKDQMQRYQNFNKYSPIGYAAGMPYLMKDRHYVSPIEKARLAAGGEARKGWGEAGGFLDPKTSVLGKAFYGDTPNIAKHIGVGGQVATQMAHGTLQYGATAAIPAFSSVGSAMQSRRIRGLRESINRKELADGSGGKLAVRSGALSGAIRTATVAPAMAALAAPAMMGGGTGLAYNALKGAGLAIPKMLGHGILGATGLSGYSSDLATKAGIGLAGKAAGGAAAGGGAGLGTTIAAGAMSPLAIGGMALAIPGMISAFSGMKAEATKRRLRGKRESSFQIVKKYRMSQPLEAFVSQLAANGKLQPQDQIKIELLRMIETHVSPIPMIGAVVKYIEDQRKKDTKASADKYYDKQQDWRDEETGDDTPTLKKRIGKKLDIASIRLQQFSALNPGQQLATWLLEGKSPAEVNKEFRQQILAIKKPGQERAHLKKVSNMSGASIPFLRLILTDSQSLLKMAESPESKMIILQSGIYDLLREEIKNQIENRKELKQKGMKIEFEQEEADAKAWENIPGAKLAVGLFKGASAVAKTIKDSYDVITKQKKWKETGIGGKVAGIAEKVNDKWQEFRMGKEAYSYMKDPDALKKNLGLFQTQKEKVSIYLEKGLPDHFNEVIQRLKEQINILQNLYNVDNKILQAQTGKGHKFKDEISTERKIWDSLSGESLTKEKYNEKIFERQKLAQKKLRKIFKQKDDELSKKFGIGNTRNKGLWGAGIGAGSTVALGMIGYALGLPLLPILGMVTAATAIGGTIGGTTGALQTAKAYFSQPQEKDKKESILNVMKSFKKETIKEETKSKIKKPITPKTTTLPSPLKTVIDLSLRESSINEYLRLIQSDVSILTNLTSNKASQLGLKADDYDEETSQIKSKNVTYADFKKGLTPKEIKREENKKDWLSHVTKEEDLQQVAEQQASHSSSNLILLKGRDTSPQQDNILKGIVGNNQGDIGDRNVKTELREVDVLKKEKKEDEFRTKIVGGNLTKIVDILEKDLKLSKKGKKKEKKEGWFSKILGNLGGILGGALGGAGLVAGIMSVAIPTLLTLLAGAAGVALGIGINKFLVEPFVNKKVKENEEKSNKAYEQQSKEFNKLSKDIRNDKLNIKDRAEKRREFASLQSLGTSVRDRALGRHQGRFSSFLFGNAMSFDRDITGNKATTTGELILAEMSKPKNSNFYAKYSDSEIKKLHDQYIIPATNKSGKEFAIEYVQRFNKYVKEKGTPLTEEQKQQYTQKFQQQQEKRKAETKRKEKQPSTIPKEQKVVPLATITEPETTTSTTTVKTTPVGPKATTTPTSPPGIIPGGKLGSLSKQYETSGKGPGTISPGIGDPGGASYGTYQMKSKDGNVVGKFIKQSPWSNMFKGLQPGTPKFNQVWRSIAENDPDTFDKWQHKFIKETHFDPFVEKLNNQLGFDLSTRSKALQDVVWSIAVQHGNKYGPGLIKKSLKGQDINSLDDKDLINLFYGERSKIDQETGKLAYFNSSAMNQQPGLKNRFRDERKDAIAMLMAERGTKKDQPTKSTEMAKMKKEEQKKKEQQAKTQQAKTSSIPPKIDDVKKEEGVLGKTLGFVTGAAGVSANMLSNFVGKDNYDKATGFLKDKASKTKQWAKKEQLDKVGIVIKDSATATASAAASKISKETKEFIQREELDMAANDFKNKYNKFKDKTREVVEKGKKAILGDQYVAPLKQAINNAEFGKVNQNNLAKINTEIPKAEDTHSIKKVKEIEQRKIDERNNEGLDLPMMIPGGSNMNPGGQARTERYRNINDTALRLIDNIFPNTILRLEESVKTFALGQSPFQILR